MVHLVEISFPTSKAVKHPINHRVRKNKVVFEYNWYLRFISQTRGKQWEDRLRFLDLDPKYYPISKNKNSPYKVEKYYSKVLPTTAHPILGIKYP